MGLFDSLASHLTEGREELAGAPKKLIEGALEMVHDQKDGLKSLVDRFQASGFGEQVKSWVSTGHNLPISADQIRQAFDKDQLEMLALKTKLSVEEVTSHLAASLPQLVDKLTPDGKLPTAGLMEHAQGLMAKLKGLGGHGPSA